MHLFPYSDEIIAEDQHDHWKDVIRECFDSFTFHFCGHETRQQPYVYELLSVIIRTLFDIAKDDGCQFVDLIANLLPEYLFHGRAMQQFTRAVHWKMCGESEEVIYEMWYKPLFAHKKHNEKHQAFQFHQLLYFRGISIQGFYDTQQNQKNTNKLFDMLLAYIDEVHDEDENDTYNLFCFTQTFDELVFVVNYVFQKSSQYDASVDVEKDVETFLDNGSVRWDQLKTVGADHMHKSIRILLRTWFILLVADLRAENLLYWTPIMHLMFDSDNAEEYGRILHFSRILQARSEENYLVNRATLVKAAK